MRQTWTALKNRTMTPADRRKAHKLAGRELAAIEIHRLRETLKVTQAELAILVTSH
jgi:DNA-binding transcriptional regulator YiaG